MRPSKHIRIAFIAAAVSFALTGGALAEAACAPEVASVMDNQRQTYIDSYNDLAQKNFSARPGSFATTTCLDNLMKGGGMDIFFKPPSLDNIFNMVKNLACEQASQIFNKALGGGGINGGGGLGPGEILKGINLGSNTSGITSALRNGGSVGSITPILGDLMK